MKVRTCIVVSSIVGSSLLAVLARAGDSTDCPKNRAGATVAAADQAQRPEVVVVRVRADWCPKCKSLDDSYSKLPEQSSDVSALFLDLDVTSEPTQRQSALMLAALGLDPALATAQHVAMVYVVDFPAKKVVATLKRGADADEVLTAVRAGTDKRGDAKSS